jgi:hypothetical protein
MTLAEKLQPIVLAMLLTSAIAQAQRPTPSLDQLLTQVQANTSQFAASVPSFSCDESLLSQESHNGKSSHETRLEASFRVSRSATPPAGLSEFREIKSIDGKPAGAEKPNLPLSINGAFSGELNRFLSADSQRCLDFTLEDTAYDSPISITFTPRQADFREAAEPGCTLVNRSTTGKALIDRNSLQVIHLERNTPQPVAGDPNPVSFLAVDFTSVELNGKSWWLPSAIVAATQDVRHGRSFLFSAHYTNYHHYSVSSTILPAGDSQPPQ